MASSEDIECRICNKRHHRDHCPMVKTLDPMILVFCNLCGCHYSTGKCDVHPGSGTHIIRKA